MKVFLFLFLLLIFSNSAMAQYRPKDEAKYLAVVKVVSNHKLNDKNVADHMKNLRESEKFKKELSEIISKLDNDRPNDTYNKKIMRILEKAGKEIYDELK